MTLCAAVVAFVVLASATAYTKKPWFDEAHFAGPALDLVTRGSMGQTVIEPRAFASNPGVDQVRVNTWAYYSVPLSHFAQAVWYKMFGFSVFKMRSLYIAWGVLAILAWAYVVRRVTQSDAMAGLAAVFIATDHFFLNSAADGRPDMQSAALGVLAMAAYLYWREVSLVKALFVSQLLLVIAVFTHPIGGIALFGVGLLLLHQGDWRRLTWQALVMAAVPYVVGGALYGYYISLDMEAFRAQMAGNTTKVGRFQSLTAPWRGVIDEFRIRFAERSYAPLGTTGARLILLAIPAIYFASVAYSLAGKRFLGIVGAVYFLVFAIFDGTKAQFYLVHFTPLLACCAAAALVTMWQQQGLWKWAAAGAGASLLVLHLGWSAYGFRKDSYHQEYTPTIAYLQQHARQDQAIYGVSELAFGLGFYSNFRDDCTLGFYTGKKADYIVVEDPGYGQAFQGFAARYPELDHYVKQTLAQYTEVYSNPVYQIYKRQGAQ